MENLLHDIVNHNLQNRKIAVIENGTWAPTSGKLMRDALGTQEVRVHRRERDAALILRRASLRRLDALADAIAADIKGKE